MAFNAKSRYIVCYTNFMGKKNSNTEVRSYNKDKFNDAMSHINNMKGPLKPYIYDTVTKKKIRPTEKVARPSVRARYLKLHGDDIPF